MISKSVPPAASDWSSAAAVYSYDLAVTSRAEQKLRSSSYPSHRRLRCSFHAGVLTLRGRVPSYYQRQLACTLVARLQGVEELNDCLEVVDAARPARPAPRFADRRQN